MKYIHEIAIPSLASDDMALQRSHACMYIVLDFVHFIRFSRTIEILEHLYILLSKPFSFMFSPIFGIVCAKCMLWVTSEVRNRSVVTQQERPELPGRDVNAHGGAWNRHIMSLPLNVNDVNTKIKSPKTSRLSHYMRKTYTVPFTMQFVCPNRRRRDSTF